MKVVVNYHDHNKRKWHRQNRSQVFVLEKHNVFICESVKTNQNPGMLLTLKENTVCFHVQLLTPKGILGGLADTFLVFNRYLFI